MGCRRTWHVCWPATVGEVLTYPLIGDPTAFPGLQTTQFPASEEAAHFYEAGPTALEQFLPFDIASPLSRWWVLLLPLLVLLVPLYAVVKATWSWFNTRRIVGWYPRLHWIEQNLGRFSAEQLDEQLAFLRTSTSRCPFGRTCRPGTSLPTTTCVGPWSSCPAACRLAAHNSLNSRRPATLRCRTSIRRHRRRRVWRGRPSSRNAGDSALARGQTALRTAKRNIRLRVRTGVVLRRRAPAGPREKRRSRHMDELMAMLTSKVGLTPDQAKAAFGGIMGFMKDKLPADVMSQIDLHPGCRSTR